MALAIFPMVKPLPTCYQYKTSLLQWGKLKAVSAIRRRARAVRTNRGQSACGCGCEVRTPQSGTPFSMRGIIWEQVFMGGGT